MPSSYDRIFADVRKDLPSIADAVVRQELFRVMDDFTQRTNIWQEQVPVHIRVNIPTYRFDTVSGKPSRLLFVYSDPGYPYAGVGTPPATPPPETGLTKFWAMPGLSMRVPGVLQLPRMPNTEADWLIVVAKRTSEPLNAESYPVIDDWIPDKYADTIGRGILARLQLEPQKPYSNPMLATANQRAYVSGCSLARANDGHANVLDSQNWTFPQGWATVARKPWT